ncbi:MAG: hypothetical protein JWO01_81 [Microbacteriaceae bacterium]|nr:hypothetical protein [Microbacteriaceae bacterium]
MSDDRDDEGLSWDGGSDPTHIDTNKVNAGALADDAPEFAGTSSAMLVLYGVFGGIYLLFTVAWLITALRTTIATGSPLDDIMTRASSILAVAAAPAWFIASIALPAGRPNWLRVVALVVGIVVLLPWGLVTGSLS